MTPLLDSIQTPSDVRQLSPQQLPALANELRSFLIESVGKTGGHFRHGRIDRGFALCVQHAA